jgi:hypothetical protein
MEKSLKNIRNLYQDFKYICNGTVYLICCTFLYYNFFERMWSLPKSFIAFAFTLSVNVFLYNLTFFIKKETLGFFFRYIYLVFFSFLLILSVIGKFNWHEIPRMSMIYDVIFNNFGTLENYISYQKIIFYLVIIFFMLVIFKNVITNQLFRLTGKNYFFLLLILSGSHLFVDWRNRVSSNTSSRELFAEDPIFGPFVKKKNYGVNLVNAYLPKKVNLKNWVLAKDAPDIVVINFDALRSDAFGKYIDGWPVTPTFDSLLSCNSTFKAPCHISSSSSSFNGILSTLYGNNAEYLPINKVGIHHILSFYGYQSNFILGGSHNHFMDLKKHYGKTDRYFETTIVGRFFSGIREDDDIGIIKYLKEIHHTDKSKKQFYYFHVMAPHVGAYRDDAPLKKELNEIAGLSEKQRSYYLGVNKADLILKELLVYFNKKKDNVVLYISSDHGEGLGIHNYLPIIGHNQQLTYETTKIPLIILDSYEMNYCNNKYSTQIDLLPTIVERCFDKFNLPEEFYPGNSIFASPLNNRFTFHSFYVTKYEDFNFAIIKDSLGQAVEKYLYNPVNGQEFIFDLKSDMMETDTIIDLEKLQYYRNKKFDFLNPK